MNILAYLLVVEFIHLAIHVSVVCFQASDSWKRKLIHYSLISHPSMCGLSCHLSGTTTDGENKPADPQPAMRWRNLHVT